MIKSLGARGPVRTTNTIRYLIHHLAFVLGRSSDRALQERLGIGFSQFKILIMISWNPSLQAWQLADGIGGTKASMGRQIKLLLDQGLLAKTVDPKNHREHITPLSPKGERVTRAALAALNDHHAPVFARLSPGQQQNLLDALSIMHDETCGLHEGRMGPAAPRPRVRTRHPIGPGGRLKTKAGVAQKNVRLLPPRTTRQSGAIDGSSPWSRPGAPGRSP